MSWRVLQPVLEGWWKPFGPVLDGIREAESSRDILTARAPALLLGAAASGLSELAKLEADARVPPPLAAGLRRAALNRDAYLARLRGPADALERAASRVRALNLPGSSGQAILRGFAEGADERTSAGNGAASGALIGNLIMPGIGGFVGGALGAAFGADDPSERNQEVFAAFDAEAGGMLEAVDQLSDAIWDDAIDHAATLGLALERSSFFAKATEAWQPLYERIIDAAQAGATDSEVAEVQGFIATWGPSPDALHLLIRLSLMPYRSSVDLGKLATMSLELYPGSAIAHEDAADAYLQLGQWAPAREVAERGFRSHPKHQGLRLSLVECLAADDAAELASREEKALLPLVGRLATIHCARGFVRRGQFLKAAGVIWAWRHADEKPYAVALQVQEDPILCVLHERAFIPKLSREEHLRAIVESHLEADSEKRFFGLPPEPRQQNARVEIVGYLEGEATLFFLDWSVWGNAKTGFALTNRRVVWKCVWEDTVKIELSSIRPEQVSVEGSTLSIGVRTVDMEDSLLAEAVGTSILRMCSL